MNEDIAALLAEFVLVFQLRPNVVSVHIAVSHDHDRSNEIFHLEVVLCDPDFFGFSSDKSPVFSTKVSVPVHEFKGRKGGQTALSRLRKAVDNIRLALESFK